MPACEFCKGIIPEGKMHCPHCRIPVFRNSTSAVGNPRITRLGSKAEKSEPVKRIPVGMFDRIFGGGVAVTSVNILGGHPGTGKTTAFLQLCDFFCIADKARDPLYIANEQSPDELDDAATRLKIKGKERIRIYNTMGYMGNDLGAVLLEAKPSMIVLDSLTKMVGDDLTQIKTIVERFKEYTIFLKAPTFLVNQVNKEGDHAGANRSLHAGDAVFHLIVDEATGNRMMYSSKNRFGEAPIELYMRMKDADSDRPGLLYEISNPDDV
jgi:DNA repair protein RadA/Sms